MNYRVDYEKQLFRTTKGRCTLYGKPARSMSVVDQKTKKASNLLVHNYFRYFHFYCSFPLVVLVEIASTSQNLVVRP